MRSRITVGAFAVTALLVSGVLAGGALESGPQVGKRLPGPFHPLNVTGSKAGQKNCLV
jgi:hypothetical protein